jgi:hypothetical protein
VVTGNNIENEAAVKLRRLLQEGAEVIGSSGGAAVGFLMGGPAGAAAGAAAGSFLGHRLRAIGEEVIQRHLSPREQVRTGAIVAAAAEARQEKLDQGYRPRQDGFFEARLGDRSTAKEITEGVLIATQREHEERKIFFMGRMLANIAFADYVNRTQANFLIRTAESISYRGLCILFVANHSDDLRLYDQAFTKYEGKQPADLPSLLSEIYSLFGQSLLMSPGAEVIRVAYIVPAKMKLQGVGVDLYNLMELGRLRERRPDWVPIAQLLGSPPQ